MSRATTLSPSELITNEDGSIYHLHLKKEDVVSTIITVGDPGRVDDVSMHFDEIYVTKQNREFKTVTGRIGAKALTVISTGIGTDNIDIVINELDALFNIDFETRQIKPELTTLKFIRIGTTGCIQSDVAIGSHLYTSYSIGFDGLMRFYRYQEDEDEAGLRKLLSMWLPSDFSYQIVKPDLAISAATLGNFLPVLTMTMAGFYGPQARSIRLKHLYTDAFFEKLVGLTYDDHKLTNFEMETNGIYGLAKLLGHQSISFSVVLANRATGEFAHDTQPHVKQLIERVIALL